MWWSLRQSQPGTQRRCERNDAPPGRLRMPPKARPDELAKVGGVGGDPPQDGPAGGSAAEEPERRRRRLRTDGGILRGEGLLPPLGPDPYGAVGAKAMIG